jgi:hypothetical protein
MLKDLLRKRQKKMNSKNSNSTSTTGFSNRALLVNVHHVEYSDKVLTSLIALEHFRFKLSF